MRELDEDFVADFECRIAEWDGIRVGGLYRFLKLFEVVLNA